MKVAIFLFGAVVGVFSTASLLLAAEVVRAYRDNTDLDPWQEYAAEEKPAKPFDWERWKTIDEINQERQAKQEFYNREDDETSPEDDEL
jgi:hypothetical protein